MTINSRKIQTAVVTGATGMIGTALCQRLCEENILVYAVCRSNSERIYHLPTSDNLKIVLCDASDFSSLPKQIGDQADAFFHLAWIHTAGSGRNDMMAQIENIRSTMHAVQSASEMGCRVFVGAGSQAEYGRVSGKIFSDTPCHPENGYGMAKLCAGQMSRLESQKLGIDHIWMRILSVYGPGDSTSTMITSTIQTLLNGQKPSLTTGEQMWDYLYSEDAANAFYRAAFWGRDGAVYPLGSGNAQPLRNYVEILRDVIDPALPLGFGEVPYSPLQVMHLQADVSTLQAGTGFVPKTDFAVGIHNTIEWVKKFVAEKHRKIGYE